MGPKITTVFRSRWNAVFWSLSVLLTAYCSVPDPDEDNGAKARKAQSAVGCVIGKCPKSHKPHNPWAKDK